MASVNNKNDKVKVAVIGGGFAGFSAAVYAKKLGFDVELFTAQNTFGGRWYSFYCDNQDMWLDNATHLISGAYDNTFNLLNILGVENYFSAEAALKVAFVLKGKISVFNTSLLPFQMGNLYAIFALKFLSLSEKLLLIKFIIKLKNYSIDKIDPRLTALDILNIEKQNGNIYKYFWKPLIISVFNTTSNNINANLFLNVLEKGFFGKKDNSRLFKALKPINKIFDIIKNNMLDLGISINFRSKLTKIKANDNNINLYIKENKLSYDKVILAIPPKSLNSLGLSNINGFSYSPIISMHIFVEHNFCIENHIALLDCQADWLFYHGINPKNNLHHYSLLKSSAEELINLTMEQIFRLFLIDLNNNFDVNEKEINYYKIIKEKYATPINPKNIDNRDLRIIYAGDAYYDNLPATIESAVISGKLAADSLLK